MNYEALFVDWSGRTSRSHYVRALIPLIAAAAFYHLLVPSFMGRWNLLILLFPAFVLLARRLHDMGHSAWLLLAPAALIAAAFWLRIAGGRPSLQWDTTLAGAAVFAAFLMWGLFGKAGREEH